VNFTITGTDANGAAVSEVLVGPNAATVKSVNGYLTITQISVSGAAAAALTVDTVQSGPDQPVVLDKYQNPQNVQIQVDVTGVVNFTVQYTNNDIFNTPPANVVWTNSPTAALVGGSTNVNGALGAVASAVRLVNNSGGGTAKMTVNQLGMMG